MCSRWSDPDTGFEAFFRDMGPTYRPGLTLERENNAGNYEPGNVVWATPSAQARNRRSNTLITINGEARVLAAWLDHFGVSRTTYKQRLRMGWTREQALTLPVGRPGANVLRYAR